MLEREREEEREREREREREWCVRVTFGEGMNQLRMRSSLNSSSRIAQCNACI